MAGDARAGDRMSQRLDSLEPVRSLIEQLVSSMADVFESMAEQRPEIAWQADSGPLDSVLAGAADSVLWWEQPLQFAPGMKIWAGAPQPTWEYSGSLVLKAAGLDSVEPGEAKNTWLEVLGQALSTVARTAGGILGREVTCEAGSETAPPDTIDQWVSVNIVFPDQPLETILVAFSLPLFDVLCTPPAAAHEAHAIPGQAPAPVEETGNFGPRSRTLDLLLDVDLPVSISFGKTQLALKDVIKLTTGSIVELNRGVNEPVEVLVNHTLVARGEVVVVDGNYGVRILEIASRSERLRSLQ